MRCCVGLWGRLCPCVFYGWVIVVVGWVALLSAGPGHSYYFVVFLEPILNELQIERTVMSATWTGCLFAAAAAQPIAGRVLDGVGPKRMLACEALPYAALVAALGGVTQLWQLAVLQFLVRAMGAGMMMMAVNVMINGWFTRRRGRASLVLCTLNTLSYLLVPVWSSLVASIGWRRTYLVMALSILANLALTVPALHSRASDLGLAPDGITSAAEQRRLEAAKPSGAVEGLGLGDALRQPIFWAYCFANFAQGGVWGGLQFHSAAMFTELGLSAADLAIAFSLISAVGVVMTIAAGMLIDGLRRKHLIFVISLIGLVIASVGLELRGRGALPATGAVVAFGAGLGVFTGTCSLAQMVTLVDLYGLRRLGTLSGVTNGMSLCGMGLGPLCVSLAHDVTGSYAEVLRGLSILSGGSGVWLLLTSYRAFEPTGKGRPEGEEEEREGLLSE